MAPQASSDPVIELAVKHFDGLKEYLGPSALKESSNPSQTRASAREKLTRLTKQQFLELATDVYDEMNRRQSSASTVPFLPVRDDFHPKRNQARQKLATLQTNRFADLASDVFVEIERRYGREISAAKSSASPPPAKSYSGSAKKYSEEKGMDHQSSFNSSPPSSNSNPRKPVGQIEDNSALNFSSLDNLMADLGSMLAHTKADDVRGNAVSNEQIEKMRSEYENRLETMQRRIHQLEDEVQSLSAAANRARELEQELVVTRQQLAESKNEIAKFQEEHDSLRNAYEGLQDDYRSQQQMTNDIRSEAATLLEEVKNLNTRNAELQSEKDQDAKKIRDLTAELERARQGLSPANVPVAVPVPISAPRSLSPQRSRDELPRTEPAEMSPAYADGVIENARVNAYHTAVEDLLRAARSDAPTNVLVAMKSIVIACKNITEDTERFEANSETLTSADRDNIGVVKNKLSSSLTGLMTAAKTHATSFGNSPVSLVEGAAGQLTQAIEELVGTLNAAAGGAPARRQSAPLDRDMDAYEIDELKVFLEKQTDLIVQAIQSLLQAMRQSQTFGSDFKDTISGITSIVDNLVSVSRRTLSRPSASSVRDRGETILGDLTAANEKLERLGEDMIESPQSKTLKQKLASASYEIAKYVKELISLIE